MNNIDQIIEWLHIAISQSPGNLNESFYYDRSKRTFFSIHAVDYFMFKDNMEFDPSANTSYTDDQLNDIVSWIKRIDKEDDQIIRIPQLGIQDSELRRIKINEFIVQNEIDATNSSSWEVDEKVSIGYDLTKDETKTSKKKWWEFWKKE